MINKEIQQQSTKKTRFNLQQKRNIRLNTVEGENRLFNWYYHLGLTPLLKSTADYGWKDEHNKHSWLICILNALKERVIYFIGKILMVLYVFKHRKKKYWQIRKYL